MFCINTFTTKLLMLHYSTGLHQALHSRPTLSTYSQLPQTLGGDASTCMLWLVMLYIQCCCCLLQSPLQALAEDADLHVRELAFAARQYATAIAEDPHDYDALYNHGLVLQELSNKLPGASKEQVQFLRQVSQPCQDSTSSAKSCNSAGHQRGVVAHLSSFAVHWRECTDTLK